MLRPLILTALALTALVPAVATAADRAPAIDPRLQAEFRASDTNNNGTLSRAEMRVRVSHMNTSRTGLTPAQATTLADRLFTQADRDGDGGVSPAEMQAAFRATARRYDTNGDGVVSLAERQAARAAITAESKGR